MSRNHNAACRTTKTKVSIPLWVLDDAGRVQTKRDADWWRAGRNGKIECDLCYRACSIPEGSAGWCRYRGNEAGHMTIPAHGEATSMIRQIRGYGPDPFLTYKPGATSLFLGATYCTSHCSFCMSTDMVWHPERTSWGPSGIRGAATDGGHYGVREMLPPAAAVAVATKWGCSQIEFGINEPTLSWEYTFDVARLAKEAGLDVVIETNGFTTEAPIRALAPYVDAVDIGIKGSGDPDFYATVMRAEGAMTAVKRAAHTWRQAGCHVIVGDVIAPRRMQSDEAAIEAQQALYGWIATELGALTPVLITPLMTPGPKISGTHLLREAGTADAAEAYDARVRQAISVANTEGLPYAHQKMTAGSCIDCHACGHQLLEFTETCGDGLRARSVAVSSHEFPSLSRFPVT